MRKLQVDGEIVYVISLVSFNEGKVLDGTGTRHEDKVHLLRFLFSYNNEIPDSKNWGII
jgi:hypothetical protein